MIIITIVVSLICCLNFSGILLNQGIKNLVYIAMFLWISGIPICEYVLSSGILTTRGSYS